MPKLKPPPRHLSAPQPLSRPHAPPPATHVTPPPPSKRDPLPMYPPPSNRSTFPETFPAPNAQVELPPPMRAGKALGIIGGIATFLRDSPDLPDRPEPRRRSPVQLPPHPPHAPLPVLPDLIAPETLPARVGAALDRPDLPPVRAPQLGGVSPIPPSMGIEAY